MKKSDADLDLNLLRYLVLLVEEGSVSRTAERLGVSQPAVSAALRRLRDRFDDPIVVRSGQAMKPTPHAVELAKQVEPLLRAVQQLARGKSPFSPNRTTRKLTLMGADYVQFFILPRLCSRLEEFGSKIQLEHRPANPSKIESWMESGQVDLGIGYLLPAPPSLRSRPLLSDTQVCILRKGHPALRTPFTMERYGELLHVAVSPAGAGIYGRRIDEALKTLGVRRQIVVTLPSFLAVPYVVASTNYAATVPLRLARYFADLVALEVVEVPAPLPSFDISMFWHERVHHDLANVWLRQEVVSLADSLRT